MDITVLEGRIDQNPASPLFARVADLYLAQGRIKDARALLEAGMNHHPSYITASIIYAKCLIAEKQFDDAKDLLTHLLLHTRDYPGIHALLDVCIHRPQQEDLQPPVESAPNDGRTSGGLAFPAAQLLSGTEVIQSPEDRGHIDEVIPPEPAQSVLLPEATPSQPGTIPDGTPKIESHVGIEHPELTGGDTRSVAETAMEAPQSPVAGIEQNPVETAAVPEIAASEPVEPLREEDSSGPVLAAVPKFSGGTSPMKISPPVQRMFEYSEAPLATPLDSPVEEVIPPAEPPAQPDASLDAFGEPFSSLTSEELFGAGGTAAVPAAAETKTDSAAPPVTADDDPFGLREVESSGEKKPEIALPADVVQPPPPVQNHEPSVSAVQSPNGRIISKTLAEIYTAQGVYEEAILTYTLLKQQRPQQSAEWDARIRELENRLRAREQEEP